MLYIKSEDKKSTKLNPEQKKQIVELYKTGEYTQRKLAEMFNVSRQTINWTINPDKYQLKKEKHYKEQRKYYDYEKYKVYRKRWLKHRKQLAKEGKLTTEKNI